jgi:lipoyl-dependent peroxiredoxin
MGATMAIRKASAQWEGTITEGGGQIALGSGAYEGPYSFQSRFEEGAGTNPEELIGAAHAGCFSMALSGVLTGAGTPPERIETDARVSIVKQGEGFAINKIQLVTRGRVPGIDQDAFQQAAQTAKETCPVSVALGGVPDISLEATLES